MYERSPPIFDRVTEADRRTALPYFRLISVDAGVRLIVEGEFDDTLVLVASGELEVTDHGVVVGRVRTGGMVGEMAVFGHGLRRATVSTSAPARLLVLDRAGYESLRAAGHPVAWEIEELALRELTRRQHRVADRIAELSGTTHVDRVARSKSLLQRLGPPAGARGLIPPGKVRRAAHLAKSPLFAGAPPDALAELAEHFRPYGATRGHPIWAEGDEGNELFVLARGQVVLLVATRDRRAEPVARLGPGDAFGIGAVVRVGEPRRTTAIARERVMALTLHKLKWAELGPRGDQVGSTLRVALIRALTEQVDYANERLASRAPADSSSGALLAAEAGIDAWGAFLARSTREDDGGGRPW
jgi:CRP-like cAMP-binding protein